MNLKMARAKHEAFTEVLKSVYERNYSDPFNKRKKLFKQREPKDYKIPPLPPLIRDNKQFEEFVRRFRCLAYSSDLGQRAAGRVLVQARDRHSVYERGCEAPELHGAAKRQASAKPRNRF